MKKTIIFLAAILMTGAAATAKSDKTETVEPFDRGITLSTSTFIPKGTVGAGITFSYNDYALGQGAGDAGYTALLSLIGDVHGNLQTWGVAPWVSYFVADNLSVGVRFDYSRSSFGLGNASLSLGDIANISISDFHYLKQAYTGAITGRYYIPFGNSKRFAMFTEVRALG